MSEFKKGDRFVLDGCVDVPAGTVITLKSKEHGCWDVEEPGMGIFTEPYLAGLVRAEKTLADWTREAPEWAKYVAQDPDGSVWAYELKPAQRHRWEPIHMGRRQQLCDTRLFKDTSACPNWRNSLHAIAAKPDADGWITWNGGERPVGANDVVDYRCRSLVNSCDLASELYWDHKGLPGDVIAYRVGSVAEAAPDTTFALPEGRHAQGYPACAGANCGTTDGVSHAPECQAEHTATCFGGERAAIIELELEILQLHATVCGHVDTMRNQGARIHAQREQLTALERVNRMLANENATLKKPKSGCCGQTSEDRIERMKVCINELERACDTKDAAISYQRSQTALVEKMLKIEEEKVALCDKEIDTLRLQLAACSMFEVEREHVIKCQRIRLDSVDRDKASLQEQLRQRTQERDAAHTALQAPGIKFTKSEIQSCFDRVRWAEMLIRKLPDEHDGRNSWLLNFGTDRAERQERWAARHGRPFPNSGAPLDNTERATGNEPDELAGLSPKFSERALDRIATDLVRGFDLGHGVSVSFVVKP